MVTLMPDVQSYQMPSHAGSGPSKVISFLMKKDDLTLLDDMVGEFPEHMNRSDVLREMILPYLHALRLAKEGKDWEETLQNGKGMLHLRGMIEEAERESAFDFSFSI